MASAKGDSSPPKDLKTVLVAVDGSPQSRAAFTWYMTNCYNEKHNVVIAHAIQAPIVYGMTDHYVFDAIVTELKEESYEIQKTYSKILKSRKIKGTFIASIERSPAEWLSEVATREKAEMIVMGTRGQGAIRRTVLGSVSDYVTHHAHCAVAVCPSIA